MRAVADTSVIVAASLQNGSGHAECRSAIRSSKAQAAGHAWTESFSVLTRLPVDVRLSHVDAARALDALIPATRWLILIGSVDAEQAGSDRCDDAVGHAPADTANAL